MWKKSCRKNPVWGKSGVGKVGVGKVGVGKVGVGNVRCGKSLCVGKVGCVKSRVWEKTVW